MQKQPDSARELVPGRIHLMLTVGLGKKQTPTRSCRSGFPGSSGCWVATRSAPSRFP